MTIGTIVIILLVLRMETAKIPSTALLHRIQQASTIEQMLHTYRETGNISNEIHLSACWICLGKLAAGSWAQEAWLKSNVCAFESLVQHTIQSVREK